MIINAPHAGINHDAILRLTDDSRDDYCAPDPLSPGVGLAGVLFMELSMLSHQSVLATDIIGSILCLSAPRRVCLAER